MVIFEELFIESRGKPITYKGKTLVMRDVLEVRDGDALRLRFESKDSECRQGVMLVVNGKFIVNNKTVDRSIVLWEDTSPSVVDFSISLSDADQTVDLEIRNVWDTGDGVINSWHNGAAMQVFHNKTDVRRYCCNDGHTDDDLNDLIFSVERLT